MVELVGNCGQAGLEDRQFGGGTGVGENTGVAVAAIGHLSLRGTVEMEGWGKAKRDLGSWQIDVRGWGREKPGLILMEKEKTKRRNCTGSRTLGRSNGKSFTSNKAGKMCIP